jgi:hypothetical protein
LWEREGEGTGGGENEETEENQSFEGSLENGKMLSIP